MEPVQVVSFVSPAPYRLLHVTSHPDYDSDAFDLEPGWVLEGQTYGCIINAPIEGDMQVQVSVFHAARPPLEFAAECELQVVEGSITVSSFLAPPVVRVLVANGTHGVGVATQERPPRIDIALWPIAMTVGDASR